MLASLLPPSPQYLHGKCSFPFISGENIWKGRFGPVLLPSYNNPFPIQLELRILFFPVKILFFSHAHCLLYWLLLHTISFSGEFSLRYKATTFIVVIFDYISLLFIISMIKWNNDNNFDAKLSFSDAIFFFFFKLALDKITFPDSIQIGFLGLKFDSFKNCARQCLHHLCRRAKKEIKTHWMILFRNANRYVHV